MSADSPRKSSRAAGVIVRPTQASEKSVVESVVDMLHDVTYSQPKSKQEEKEKVKWCSFEEVDLNDLIPHSQKITSPTDTMLLILGYANGIHIWALLPNGEAQEVLSLRQGYVKLVKLLPTPQPLTTSLTGQDRQDMYCGKRPLIAVCDGFSAGSVAEYCSVRIISLLTGDEVKCINMKQKIHQLLATRRVLAISTESRIELYETCQFSHITTVTSCYPVHTTPNCMALGSRWLAYVDRKLVPAHQSGGGVSNDGSQGVTATVISAAKKGYSMIQDTVSSLAGIKHSPLPTKRDPVQHSSVPGHGSNIQAGVVTVVDVMKVNERQIQTAEDCDGSGLVAHFQAYRTEQVIGLAFDHSGAMLCTAGYSGTRINVYRILAHPFCSVLGAVHHLYTLYRGDTEGKVQGISFSNDSRWITISTLRGTTHLFPITPYGGPITRRTHFSRNVANRSSRFHRSSGIDEMDAAVSHSGRQSPILSHSSPSSSPGRRELYRTSSSQLASSSQMSGSNPRLPPYPNATTVNPMVQIRHSYQIPGISTTPATSASRSPTNNDVLCVAACFASSRGWVGAPREPTDDTKHISDGLFVLNWSGDLTEYIIEMKPAVVSNEKVSDDTPVTGESVPRAHWNLGRSMTMSEVNLPLSPTNLLLCGYHNTSTPTSRVITDHRYMSQHTTSSPSQVSTSHSDAHNQRVNDEQWLSQVEINTYSGPNRRLWMGPQFRFSRLSPPELDTTGGTPAGGGIIPGEGPSPVLKVDGGGDAFEEDLNIHSLQLGDRSQPVAMPPHPSSSSSSSHQQHPLITTRRHRSSSSSNSISIDAGSYGTPPKQIDAYPSFPIDDGIPSITCDDVINEETLKESLADAMLEPPFTGGLVGVGGGGPNSTTQDISDIAVESSEDTSSFDSAGSSVPDIHTHNYPSITSHFRHDDTY